MKVLSLPVTFLEYQAIKSDAQSMVQKRLNLNWTGKLVSVQTQKFKVFNVVKITAFDESSLYYELDGITIGLGSRALGTSSRKVYYNIHLGVETGAPEED